MLWSLKRNLTLKMKIFEDWLDKVEINDEDTEIEISSHPDNPLKFNEWRRYDSTYLIGLWQGRDIYKPRDCKEYQAKFYELIPGIFLKLRYILDNINSIDSYYFELHIRCELPND